MLCPEKLTLYISRFILEVWKKDGTEYPPNTLYHIVCGLMRHLHQNGMPDVDFFKEKAYTDLRTTLDAEMKRLKLLRIGATKRQAEFSLKTRKNCSGEVSWDTILPSRCSIPFFSSMEYALLLEAVKSTANLGGAIVLKYN